MEVIIILITYVSSILHNVKGERSNIKDFPHSVFITIDCRGGNKLDFFSCGASILNQAILITAAHCLDDCHHSLEITAYIGHEHRYEGLKTKVSDYKKHENFDWKELDNDIALLRLQNDLIFSEKIKRVALMKKPLFDDTAVVAGWGRRDVYVDSSDWLIHMTQTILPREACALVLGARQVPPGAFCTRKGYGLSNVGEGGSGSALIVREFIQIGILSFHMPKRSKNIEVYTDIGYFYDWITETSKNLYCYGKKENIV